MTSVRIQPSDDGGQAAATDCFAGAFAGRRVLLTGHTGFKGSWLSTWLLRLGAELQGLALDPDPSQTLFDQLGLAKRLAGDHRVDVSDGKAVAAVVARTRPEYVFHLAAQPLVRASYQHPVETFTTNVIGTVNVLDAVRHLAHPCSVVVVTTDKCYENREWLSAYREDDPMGGFDPYSASKGCAELATSAYRRSYFSQGESSRIASARAGNVIGGGDWAVDRIVPDIFRAIQNGEPVLVRNRRATRPWQHVLEPLSGYLWLAAALDGTAESCDGRDRREFCSAFNFGPGLASNRTVAELVEAILAQSGGKWVDHSDPTAPHEAAKLNLAIDRAFHMLRWRPVWQFTETIKHTAVFYNQVADGADASNVALRQIQQYEAKAAASGLAWACGRTKHVREFCA